MSLESKNPRRTRVSGTFLIIGLKKEDMLRSSYASFSLCTKMRKSPQSQEVLGVFVPLAIFFIYFLYLFLFFI